MKLLPLILVLAHFFLSCQTHTFKYSDDSFEIDDIHITSNLSYAYWKRPTIEDSLLLNDLYDFLVKHPNIYVEIGKHTDTKGSKNYNLKFSQKTAEYVVNWLVNKGINKDRLKAVGYGGMYPIVSDNNISKMKNQSLKDEAHQKNNRIEIKIIEIKDS